MADRAAFLDHMTATLRGIEAEGLLKRERLITSAQGAHIAVGDRQMINLCANNYLGLADQPVLIAAATSAMAGHGCCSARCRSRKRANWRSPAIASARRKRWHVGLCLKLCPMWICWKQRWASPAVSRLTRRTPYA